MQKAGIEDEDDDEDEEEVLIVIIAMMAKRTSDRSHDNGDHMQLGPGLNKCLNRTDLALVMIAVPRPGIGPAVASLRFPLLPWLSWPRTFL